MKVLKWFLLAFVVALVLFFTIAQFLPGGYWAERSITINVPRHVVYEAVVDLEVWQEWEPWGQIDDSNEIVFGESTRGPGASYSWSGDRIGNGELRILEAEPGRIRYEFIFNRESEQPAYAEIELEPIDDETTKVTWTFSGDLGANPLDRYFGLLIGPMVGERYEEGLESLKALLENRDEDGEDVPSSETATSADPS